VTKLASAPLAAAPSNRQRASSRELVGLAGFLLLLATYSLNAVDRQIFPFLLRDVQKEYALSISSAGLLSTVFTLGMALSGVPTGYLMSRLSRRSVIQVGILIFSAATLLTPTAPGFWSMTTFRALTGVGEAMQLTALLAIAGSYFVKQRALAVGSINTSFGIGAIIGPALGGMILARYGTWHAPMIVFGLVGLAAIALVALFVRPWLSEAVAPLVAATAPGRGGAPTLMNRDTILLGLMSVLGGLVIYGYLGMYPSYLRGQLGYTPAETAHVMAFFGFGVLASVAGGFVGDWFSARTILGVAFLSGGLIGFGLFHGSADVGFQSALSFGWGIIVSGTIYVNLAAFHVKAVSRDLAAQSSGIFVSTLYGSASVAGYLFGFLAERIGWAHAADVQIVGACILAAALSLPLRSGRTLKATDFISNQ
jgi:MFS transporter, DHA1 family, inner membrane transport protein